MKPFLPGYLKTQNRKLIFELFQQNHIMSRSEVARATGISFPTVLKAVDKLLELSILTELEETELSEGAGRKGHLLRFEPCSYFALGIVFEGQMVSAGLVDLSGHCHAQRTLKLSLTQASQDLPALRAVVEDLLSCAQKRGAAVLGAGVGFPAVIDPATKTLQRLPKAGYLEKTAFGNIFPDFCAALPAPYYLDNDVNLSCIGEAFLRRGMDKPDDPLLYISLGTGCGAGFFFDGHIWRGSHFKSGELGELMLGFEDLPQAADPRYSPFEDRINLAALSARFGIDLRDETPTDMQKKEISAYLLPYLRLMLYNLTNILDIQQCVLTGIIPKALGSSFLERLTRETNLLMASGEALCVEPSVSDSAGLVGAACTVFDHQLENLLKV